MWEDEYSFSLIGMMGTAHVMTHDGDSDDTIRRLHEVVEEVTGKKPEQPEPRRIGFY